MGVAVADVIAGFEAACDKALEILPSLVCHTVEDFRDKEMVRSALHTCIASKQYGLEDYLAGIITDACVDVLPKEKTRNPFNVDNVRVSKILGSGVQASRVVRGMLFLRSASGTVTSCSNAKIAVYTAALDYAFTETKGTVLLNTAEELKNYSKEEESLLETQLKAIAETGVNVIVTGGKVGDMALHFCDRLGIMVVKLNSKYDLRRLCRATRATALPRVIPPTPHEIGHCDHVELEEIGETTVTIFRQDDVNSAVSTIVVRGATDNIMDDIERAVDDGVNNYKALTKDQRYVPGAGATEIELAMQLAEHGETCPGLEQYAIKAFAEALEIVPHTLAENAGVKAKELVSKLYSAHKAGDKNAGFDNEGDGVVTVDAAQANIIDHYLTKYWSLVYATRAACTVLRVDQIIMAKRAGGPKPPKNQQYDED
jgi:T-complex protein 1 subunit theta